MNTATAASPPTKRPRYRSTNRAFTRPFMSLSLSSLSERGALAPPTATTRKEELASRRHDTRADTPRAEPNLARWPNRNATPPKPRMQHSQKLVRAQEWAYLRYTP